MNVINTTDIEIIEKLIEAPISASNGSPTTFDLLPANMISNTYQITITNIMTRSGRRDFTSAAIASEPTSAPMENVATSRPRPFSSEPYTSRATTGSSPLVSGKAVRFTRNARNMMGWMTGDSIMYFTPSFRSVIGFM